MQTNEKRFRIEEYPKSTIVDIYDGRWNYIISLDYKEAAIVCKTLNELDDEIVSLKRKLKRHHE